MRKDKGVHLHKPKRQHNMVTHRPDQVLEGSSSAMSSAANSMGNLCHETHPRQVSGITALISTVFCYTALDIQNLICKKSKLKKKKDFHVICLTKSLFYKMIWCKTINIFGKKYCIAHSTTDQALVWPSPTSSTVWQAADFRFHLLSREHFRSPPGAEDEAAFWLCFCVDQKTAASLRGTGELGNTFLSKMFFSRNLEGWLTDSHASLKHFFHSKILLIFFF